MKYNIFVALKISTHLVRVKKKKKKNQQISFLLMTGLRGAVSVLEIVFVGQCEVFVCLDFALTFFSLGLEAHRSANGASIF